MNQQDIEQLGWIANGIINDTYPQREGKYVVKKFFDKMDNRLFLFDNDKIIIQNISNTFSTICFNGTIQSKSQLKTLMKQLNIEL